MRNTENLKSYGDDPVSSALCKKNAELTALIQNALRSGATEVAIVSARDIIVEQALADLCREPRCENYGLSKSCPPHVSGPAAFKNRLGQFGQGLFFKIDVPSEILFSSERREFFQLLHEIAAGIEHDAKYMGFPDAKAYAGGSCKTIFCHNHRECLALSEKGICRNPLHARPSMSGFGINVSKLIETAGWTKDSITHGTHSAAIKTAAIYGLVLIH